jgi:NADH-quinone oxidoreductase subunit L
VQKLYFDITYDWAFVRPFLRLSGFMAVFDLKRVDGVVNGVAHVWGRVTAAGWDFDARYIDGAVNGIAGTVRALGSRLRSIQTGRIQTYQRLAVGALVALLVVIVAKGA